MKTKFCNCCGKQFRLRPQVPNQAYCSSPGCQRARKRHWQQDKLQNDPAYRGNQRDAQRAWQERHPDYWRGYRDTHPEYAERNRKQQRLKLADRPTGKIAKMEALALPSGIYRIKIVAAASSAINGVWLVEIMPVCQQCPCKKDVCK